MRHRYLVLAFATAAAAVLAIRARSGEGGSAPEAAPSERAGAARFVAPHRPAGGALVARARYRLHFEQHVAVGGKQAVTLRAEGAWTTTPRSDGRTEVRFSPAALDGPPGELPRREDLAASAQLVHEDGVLTAIGFPDELPTAARKLLTGLATTFQYTDRSGDSWKVGEEDLSGRYDAVYVRAADAIQRSRPRYTALRGAGGLTEGGAGGVTPAEQTRFIVDAHGVVSARVELDVTFALGEGMAPARLRLRGSLTREALEQVEASGGTALAAAPISSFADFEGARRNADESLVAGATATELLEEVARAIALPGRDGGNARAQALARLAALVRLEPEAAEELAAHVRRRPEQIAEVRVIAGALASARSAAGTDALAGLAAEERSQALPDEARGVVVGALSFASPVTPAGLRALSQGIDRPHGDQAALGLGTHAHKVRDADPAAADRAIDALLDRHARAGSDAERRLYLEALGNSGATRALPVLRAALGGGDRRLASAAVFSLRFVPGADVDALLAQVIERSTDRPELAFAAIRAAAYRDPARWRPLLAAAQARYPEHEGIQGEIRAILRRWGA